MYKAIKRKKLFSDQICQNFNKKSLFQIKNLSNIKNHLKNIRIDDPNSKLILNQIKGSNITTKYTNSKNNTLDEKFENNNKTNLNTETIFSRKELILSKRETIIKDKKLNKTNIIEKQKGIKIGINTYSSKNNKNISHNINKLTKKYDKDKFNKILLSNTINNFMIYKKNTNIKKDNISKKSRNKDSPDFYKYKNNNNFYLLNKRNNKSSVNAIKSRNIKSIYITDELNKNKISINSGVSINYKSPTNLNNYYKDKTFDIKKISTIYKHDISKPKNKKLRKTECLSFFNSDINIIKKNVEKNFQFKSEQKRLKKKIKGNKKMEINDLIKTEENKRKNWVVKKIKFYDFKKSDNNKNCERQSKYSKKEKTNIRSKTNTNSKKIINSFDKKPNKNKDFKSCDISLLRPKKRKKKKKIIPIKLNNKNLLKEKIFSLTNDSNCKKNIGISQNIKDYFHNKVKNKKKKNLHKYYLDDEYYYKNILELDDENKNNLINEIKTNIFYVKKPNEQNMKFTIFKEFTDERKEESNITETQISNIVIGEIDGYKDIIEKDKINSLKNKLKENYYSINENNINKITKIKFPLNESGESEKNIINLINIDEGIDNMSTNDFKNINFDNQKIKYNNIINNKISINIHPLIIKNKINYEKMKNKNQKNNPNIFKGKLNISNISNYDNTKILNNTAKIKTIFNSIKNKTNQKIIYKSVDKIKNSRNNKNIDQKEKCLII